MFLTRAAEAYAEHMSLKFGLNAAVVGRLCESMASAGWTGEKLSGTQPTLFETCKLPIEAVAFEAFHAEARRAAMVTFQGW